MVSTPEEGLAREIRRFSERCVHENHAGCSLGLDPMELSGTKDRPHWKRPPNICFRPCLGSLKEGDAACEMYEKPTAQAVRERAIDIELERLRTIEQRAAEQAERVERESRKAQRINQVKRIGESR